MEDIEFETLKYAELQKIAKRHGIRANQKADKLLAALKKVSGTSSQESSQSEREYTTSTTDSEAEHAAGKTVSRARKGRKKTKGGRRVPQDHENLTSEDDEKSSKKPRKSLAPRSQSSCAVAAVKSKSVTPVSRSKTCTPASTSSSQAASKTVSKSVTPQSSTRSITPKNQPKSVASKGQLKAVSSKGRSKSITPKGRSKSAAPKGRSKSATPKDRAVSVAPNSSNKSKVTSSGTTSRRSSGSVSKLNKTITPNKPSKIPTPSSKSRTSSLLKTKQSSSGKASTSKARISSAGKKWSSKSSLPTDDDYVKKNIETLMTDDEENGENLMTEDEDDEIIINPTKRRRRNTYTREAPSSNVKELLDSMQDDMSEEQRKKSLMAALDKKIENSTENAGKKHQSGSNIPRFTGVVSKGNISASKQDAKAKTPGKDWAKIHKRQWDKMDSLDEYLARKRKRTETITQSVKKLKIMSQELKTSMETRKERRSSGSVKKNAKSAAFLSPAPAFQPTVTSTTKMNLNFGGSVSTSEKNPFKGNKDSLRKSPRAWGEAKPIKGGQPLFSVGHGDKKPDAAPTPSKENKPSRKSFATPGKPSSAANKSLTTASTKKFNITASLAKPVTWKAHKGQLKPFSLGNLYNRKTNVKEVKVKSRDDRRQEASHQRKAKKADLHMSRRGIDA